MPKIISPSGLSNWKGLDERKILDQDPATTSSLDNVIVRNGVVKGRLGMSKFDSITDTDADTPILGHFSHYDAASATTSVLRMTPTKMRKWNSSTHAWDDITGTALNGNATTRPVLHTLSDEGFSTFCNEGHDRPRKYTGSGNTAVLGGTPPYCKWLCPYVGFLWLFNTSTDGTFGATADPITAYFSDQPDVVWDLCEGNAMVFDETSGELVAADSFGDMLVVFKSDGIIQTRFVGGLTRFNRRKLNFSHGLMAPMSLQRLGQYGLIFLATDRNIYITDGQAVKPLPTNVQKSLQETMAIGVAKYCRSFVDLDHETYHLLYQRDGSSYFDGVLSYNYSTGEFCRSVYPVEFNAALGFRVSPTTAWRTIASSSNLTYELETSTDDDGTAVSRYFDIDWTTFGLPGTKYFTGGELSFEKARDCRVKVSVAVDKSSKFVYPKWFDLRGRDPEETTIRVAYDLPSPLYGTWFKVRIEFFQDGSTNVCTLLDFTPELIPMHKSSDDTPSLPQPVRI